jgi:AcrR family transcriptional regulator
MPDGRIVKGEETRRRLVATGRALFGARGYEGTSIEAIFEAAGISRGALYHHFPTKEALFDAVLDHVMGEIAAASARAAQAAPDTVSGLRAGFTAWLDAVRDPEVQRIALVDAPAVVGWGRLREIDSEHVLAGMTAMMRRLGEEGRLPAGDVDVLTHMLLAAVGEAALLVATADDRNGALDAARTTLEGLIDRLLGT